MTPKWVTTSELDQVWFAKAGGPYYTELPYEVHEYPKDRAIFCGTVVRTDDGYPVDVWLIHQYSQHHDVPSLDHRLTLDSLHRVLIITWAGGDSFDDLDGVFEPYIIERHLKKLAENEIYSAAYDLAAPLIPILMEVARQDLTDTLSKQETK